MKLIPNLVVRVKVQQQSRLLTKKNALLSSLLIFGIFVFTTEATFAESTYVVNPVTTAPLSPKEFADLFKAKKVSNWLPPGSKKQGPVVNLSSTECKWLGGTIAEGPNCMGTLLKCVGSNGNTMCIDDAK